jgi:hypothetical protein
VKHHEPVSAGLMLMQRMTMCLLVCIYGSQQLPYEFESCSLVFPNPIVVFCEAIVLISL